MGSSSLWCDILICMLSSSTTEELHKVGHFFLGRFLGIQYLQWCATSQGWTLSWCIREEQQNGGRRVLERLSNISLSPGLAPNVAVHHLTGDKRIKKGPLTPAFFIPSLLQQRAVLNRVPRWSWDRSLGLSRDRGGFWEITQDICGIPVPSRPEPWGNCSWEHRALSVWQSGSLSIWHRKQQKLFWLRTKKVCLLLHKPERLSQSVPAFSPEFYFLPGNWCGPKTKLTAELGDSCCPWADTVWQCTQTTTDSVFTGLCSCNLMCKGQLLMKGFCQSA